MTTARRPLATFLAGVLASGCATTHATLDGPGMGHPVTLVMQAGKQKLKGELLAVEKDRLWVRAEDGVHEVPLGAVVEARVKRLGFGARQAMTWASLGGLVTGGALTAACASVEDTSNCGTAGFVTLAAWLIVGGLAAPSIESSRQLELVWPKPDDLRAFARLPQGLPPGITPATLVSATGKATPSEER